MIYRFDDIIINSLQRRAGVPGDEKNYITMNNIKSRDLSITEWGVPEPFYDERLIVKKGDVLFIKHDPFNHQVGISPIDGMFTGYGMVLRPKEEVILPEFLPYFIFSEVFISKVSSIAVGTNHKTCNWKEMKALEFDIPTLEEQAKLLEVIREINKLSDYYSSLINDLRVSPDSFLQSVISDKCSSYTLGQLMTFQTKTEKLADASKINYITYDEIANNARRKPAKSGSFYAYHLKKNQLIAPRNAFYKGNMALIPAEYDGYYTANIAQVFNISSDLVLPEYLYMAIRRPAFTSQLENVELTVANWDSTFSLHSIAVPSIEDQKKYLSFCQKTSVSLTNARKCKEQTYKTLQSVLGEHIKAE